MGLRITTLQRWRSECKADGNGIDRRKGSTSQVAQRLTPEECQRILHTCNEPKYASLPPGQIVPDIADQGIYISSKRSFYGVCMPTGSSNGDAVRLEELRDTQIIF